MFSDAAAALTVADSDPIGSVSFVGSKNFLVKTNPDSTHYPGIIEGSPVPARYAVTSRGTLHLLYVIQLYLLHEVQLHHWVQS
jgi:hypothetical protein